MKNISVIIPAYNEAQSIGAVIANLKYELKNLHLENYEIIVVNDGSVDETQNILNSISGIKVIEHLSNKGYGASIKSGLKKCLYDWVLIIDADGTYPTSAIRDLLIKTDEYDQVIGSREKKSNGIPLKRKYAKKFLNKFASYLSGHKIPDLNSGLRIFKKKIVLEYWELFPKRFSFTSTLTMICLIHGYDTAFVPIDYYKRQSKSSLKSIDFLNFIRLVVKLSLFFRPIKVFLPLSVGLLILALLVASSFVVGLFNKFPDVTFIVLCATALQTLFFGLLAEIIIHRVSYHNR